ncbi:hypothetical protein LTR17_013759 [Elasticomyces elasticus]|nr:hypothetical protein LTR17_013759 [Elasticomyces elasticus]
MYAQPQLSTVHLYPQLQPPEPLIQAVGSSLPQTLPPRSQLPQPDYSYLLRSPPVELAAPATPAVQSSTTTTITSTARYEGFDAGGEARRLAEARGQAAVHQHQWFNMNGGWICGGGTHFIWHDDVDELLLGTTSRTSPTVIPVNSRNSQRLLCSPAHPPDTVHHLPMHQAHRDYMRYLARKDVPVTSEPRDPCTCVRDLGKQ